MSLSCSTCHRELKYPAGAKGVKCPGCRQVTRVSKPVKEPLPEPTITGSSTDSTQIARIACSQCGKKLYHKLGAKGVKCPGCQHVTLTGVTLVGLGTGGGTGGSAPKAGKALKSMACRSCRKKFKFSKGALRVQCPACHTINDTQTVSGMMSMSSSPSLSKSETSPHCCVNGSESPCSGLSETAPNSRELKSLDIKSNVMKVPGHYKEPSDELEAFGTPNLACRKCHTPLWFPPGTTSVNCTGCGEFNTLVQGPSTPLRAIPEASDVQTVRCEWCHVELMREPGVLNARCSSCGRVNTLQDTPAKDQLVEAVSSPKAALAAPPKEPAGRYPLRLPFLRTSPKLTDLSTIECRKCHSKLTCPEGDSKITCPVCSTTNVGRKEGRRRVGKHGNPVAVGTDGGAVTSKPSTASKSTSGKPPHAAIDCEVCGTRLYYPVGAKGVQCVACGHICYQLPAARALLTPPPVTPSDTGRAQYPAAVSSEDAHALHSWDSGLATAECVQCGNHLKFPHGALSVKCKKCGMIKSDGELPRGHGAAMPNGDPPFSHHDPPHSLGIETFECPKCQSLVSLPVDAPETPCPVCGEPCMHDDRQGAATATSPSEDASSSYEALSPAARPSPHRPIMTTIDCEKCHSELRCPSDALGVECPLCGQVNLRSPNQDMPEEPVSSDMVPARSERSRTQGPDTITVECEKCRNKISCTPGAQSVRCSVCGEVNERMPKRRPSSRAKSSKDDALRSYDSAHVASGRTEKGRPTIKCEKCHNKMGRPSGPQGAPCPTCGHANVCSWERVGSPVPRATKDALRAYDSVNVSNRPTAQAPGVATIECEKCHNKMCRPSGPQGAKCPTCGQINVCSLERGPSPVAPSIKDSLSSYEVAPPARRPTRQKTGTISIECEQCHSQLRCPSGVQDVQCPVCSLVNVVNAKKEPAGGASPAGDASSAYEASSAGGRQSPPAPTPPPAPKMVPLDCVKCGHRMSCPVHALGMRCPECRQVNVRNSGQPTIPTEASGEQDPQPGDSPSEPQQHSPKAAEECERCHRKLSVPPDGGEPRCADCESGTVGEEEPEMESNSVQEEGNSAQEEGNSAQEEGNSAQVEGNSAQEESRVPEESRTPEESGVQVAAVKKKGDKPKRFKSWLKGHIKG
eukprot:evm.model.scf_261EXC.7 EVM.evm.TU.scf_261EXC.7   scf_261EXC:78857-82273(-)